jgi:hypothetical protein
MKIYRAVSEAEKNSIEQYHRFFPIPGFYESKLFASSFEDARKFGRNIYNIYNFDVIQPFYIVEVEIDDEYTKKFGYELLDADLGVGDSVIVDRDLLSEFNELMTYNMLNYV